MKKLSGPSGNVMNDITNQDVPGAAGEKPKKRPELLKVLCILTFIGSGLSFLANAIMYLTIDVWKAAYQEGVFSILEGKVEMKMIDLLMNVNPNYYMFQALLFGLSVYGAYLMWKLKKAGFHMYTISQILLLIVSKVFIPSQPFPVVPLLLSLVFVLLYARSLKVMQ